MSGFEALALAAVSAIAGAMNAVAGGGTMLTFPLLIFLGSTAVRANATSTLALVIGTAGSVYGFRERMAAIKPWLGRFVPVSVLGGWLGSVLLTRTSEGTFERLVPFLILFATVLFLTQGAFRRLAQAGQGRASAGATWGAIAFQFGISVYGGYFGAGIGILMLASLGILGLEDIHEMNALKNVLSFLINIVASIWFAVSGLVDWPIAGVMTAGAVAGYYLGAHYSQRISQQAVRRIVTGVGLGISAILFYREFA